MPKIICEKYPDYGVVIVVIVTIEIKGTPKTVLLGLKKDNMFPELFINTRQM